MAKKKEKNSVVVVIGDWELDVDVKSSGNRKTDLANALSSICSDDEMIDGDKKFAKDVEKEINALYEEMHIGDDAEYWKGWKTECLSNLKDTYKRTVKDNSKDKKESVRFTICFENYDITVPFGITENVLSDLFRGVEWISNQPDIIEGDYEFAKELYDYIDSHVKEAKNYPNKGLHLSSDLKIKERFGTLEDFANYLKHNIDRSVAIYKLDRFHMSYDFMSKAISIENVTNRLQNLHGLFLTKEKKQVGAKRKSVYTLHDWDDNFVVSFESLSQVYKYELELNEKMLKLAEENND